MKKIALAIALCLIAATVYASTIRATLSWNDSTGETGYRIERAAVVAGPYTAIGTVAADVTTFADDTLVAGGSYCWRIVAFNAIGDALPSTAACATAPSLPTPAGGLQVIITVVP